MAQQKPQREIALSDLQLDLMHILWATPDSTAAEVGARLRVKRPLAHTTVATLLTRLEKRGLLIATRDARQIRYRAAVSKTDVRRSMVSALIAGLFDNDAGALLSHLVDQRAIRADELAQIRSALERKERS